MPHSALLITLTNTWFQNEKLHLYRIQSDFAFETLKKASSIFSRLKNNLAFFPTHYVHKKFTHQLNNTLTVIKTKRKETGGKYSVRNKFVKRICYKKSTYKKRREQKKVIQTKI